MQTDPIKHNGWDFHGDIMDRNPPSNAEDLSVIPGLRGVHIPKSS